MRLFKKVVLITLVVFFAIGVVFSVLAVRPIPDSISYGMSFNTLYARELGLSWRDTYDAILDDLGVRKLRLAAHWTMIEPEDDAFNFEELDYQLDRAEEVGASVIFGVGRRLPRWPECHVPDWAEELSKEKQQAEVLEQIATVIERYKDRAVIDYWQVENEPFLEVFAREHCGDLDVSFFEEEIALVKQLDPTRPVLVTDSGNIGLWYDAYRRGDAFGTSVYVFLWNPEIGPFRTVLPPSYYRIKENIMRILFSNKKTFLIELSVEPWLLQPVAETPIDIQLSRMNLEKFEEILRYAEGTRLSEQYLWGAEWWYWLKEHGDERFWERGEKLFSESKKN